MVELSVVNLLQVTYLFCLLMVFVGAITGTIKAVARYKYVSSKFVGQNNDETI